MIIFSLQTSVKEFGVTMVSHRSLFMYFVVYCGFLNFFLLHSQPSMYSAGTNHNLTNHSSQTPLMSYYLTVITIRY